MQKLIKILMMALVLVSLSVPSFAADLGNGFSLTYTTNISVTPNQIGFAQWRGETTNVGAAACLDSIAVLSNGPLHLGLGEVCGGVGGGVQSSAGGKLSMPLTIGIKFFDGPLALHLGFGPDLMGTPVTMWAATYPF